MKTNLKFNVFIVFALYSISLYSQEQEFLTAVSTSQLKVSEILNNKISEIKSRKEVKEAIAVRIGKLSAIQNRGAIPFSIPGRKNKLVAHTTSIEYISDDHYTWKGTFSKVEGTALIMARDGEIFGNIRLLNEVFDLQYLENDFGLLIRYDTEVLNAMSCGNTEDFDINDADSNDGLGASGDESNSSGRVQTHGNIVRVLVLFTTAANNAVTNINNTAILAVQQLNDAKLNSAISYNDLYYERAGTQFLNFTESQIGDIFQDVQNLRNNAAAQNLRNQFEADLVVLLTNGPYGGSYGIAANFGPDDDDAYAIVQVNQATSSLTFAHETGHLMGGHHQQCAIYFNPGCDNIQGDPHGYGFKTGTWPFRTERVTIMHQLRDGWNQEMHFSNPDVEIKNKATGVTGSNNNARVFRVNAPVIANFRDFTPPVTVTISGPAFGNNAGTYTWTSSVTDGTAPYTYLWEYSTDGFNYSYFGNTADKTGSLPYNQHLHLRLTVTDANGIQDQAFHYTNNSDADGCIKCRTDSLYAAVSEADNRAERLYLYPNPSGSDVSIIYNMVKYSSEVEVIVYDLNGKVVLMKVLAFSEKGIHTIPLNVSNIQPGQYVLKLAATADNLSKTIIIE